MSAVEKISSSLARLPDLIMQFEEDLTGIEDILAVRGKTLEHALKEQAAYPYYFDSRRCELKTLAKFLEANMSSVRGKLTRQYIEQSSRALSERVMNSYIDHESEFATAHVLYLEAFELLEKYEAISEAFTKRGYALRDITAARTKDVHNAIL
jgi:hypothetical protein